MRAVFWWTSGVGGHCGRWHAGGLAPHVRYERLLRVEAPTTDAALRGCAAGRALERKMWKDRGRLQAP